MTTPTRQRTKCRRCGHSPVRKPSRLPVAALVLVAAAFFYGAIIVGLLYGALYGAGLLFVWYGLCLAAFRTYERGRK